MGNKVEVIRKNEDSDLAMDMAIIERGPDGILKISLLGPGCEDLIKEAHEFFERTKDLPAQPKEIVMIDCSQRYQPDSQGFDVDAYGYDGISKVLRIKLKATAGYLDYLGVPINVVLDMESSPSLGHYFRTEIKFRYKSEKVEL